MFNKISLISNSIQKSQEKEKKEENEKNEENQMEEAPTSFTGVMSAVGVSLFKLLTPDLISGTKTVYQAVKGYLSTNCLPAFKTIGAFLAAHPYATGAGWAFAIIGGICYSYYRNSNGEVEDLKEIPNNATLSDLLGICYY